MQKVWEMFTTLTKITEEHHEGKECGHHPHEHAVMVAQYALIIAENESVGEYAAIAGLLHNSDRLFPEEKVDEIVRQALHEGQEKGDFYLLKSDVEDIVSAVLNHHTKNEDADSAILVCLKDADRLANIRAFDIIARSARHYPNLPLVDPRYIETIDPDSTYRNPKTVFRDAVLSTLEWERWLRLPKAIELGKKYFDGLRAIQALTKIQLEETGLNQYKT
jgi:hypothetical protein